MISPRLSLPNLGPKRSCQAPGILDGSSQRASGGDGSILMAIGLGKSDEFRLISSRCWFETSQTYRVCPDFLRFSWRMTRHYFTLLYYMHIPWCINQGHMMDMSLFWAMIFIWSGQERSEALSRQALDLQRRRRDLQMSWETWADGNPLVN